MKLPQAIIDTPLGKALLEADDIGLTRCELFNGEETIPPHTPVLKKAAQELTSYFRGELTEFSVPLNPSGTIFQLQVWQALQDIPYGTTCSYMELSRNLGNTKAIRAVASANGKNPLWIFIPCHRVIGSDGSLTGYAGGLWRKERLLALEGSLNQPSLFDSEY